MGQAQILYVCICISHRSQRTNVYESHRKSMSVAVKEVIEVIDPFMLQLCLRDYLRLRAFPISSSQTPPPSCGTIEAAAAVLPHSESNAVLYRSATRQLRMLRTGNREFHARSGSDDAVDARESVSCTVI